GRLVGDTMRPPYRRKRLAQVAGVDALGAQQLASGGPPLLRERDEKMLGGHVRIAECLGLLVGAVEDPVQLAAERRLSPARLGGEATDLPVHRRGERGDVEPRLLQQRTDDAVLLRQQRGEQVRVVDDGVASLPRSLAGVAKSFLTPDRKPFRSNHRSPFFCNLEPAPIRGKADAWRRCRIGVGEVRSGRESGRRTAETARGPRLGASCAQELVVLRMFGWNRSSSTGC